jgi:hypothetical protein
LKSIRQIGVADHLWEALERMSAEMGVDREALVNQAIHVLARLNGYLVPGTVGTAVPPPVPQAAEPDSVERQAVAERVLETAARLERAMQDRPSQPRPAAPANTGALFLLRDDGSEIEVLKERFLIGRGRHCDLVVESGKVSREHAAIVREGGAWFVEDLGSANGTWLRRERIDRRRIADGDELYVCAERVRCALR